MFSEGGDYFSISSRTQPEIKLFNYTWRITKFWDIYRFANILDSSFEENQPVAFVMDIDRKEDKLKFYAIPATLYKAARSRNNTQTQLNNTQTDNTRTEYFDVLKTEYTKTISASYSVFLKTSKGKRLRKYNPRCLFNTIILLYEVHVSLLSEKALKYLANDTLTVCFQFRFFECVSTQSISKYIIDPYRYMSNSLKNKHLLSNVSDSVVTFVSNGSLLYVSKFLLCSKSMVFNAMFNCNLKESKNDIVEITDIDYEVLIQLVNFVETNIPPKLNGNLELIFDLLIAADKYDINDLKTICENYIIKEVTIENVAKFLYFACTYNATNLKNYSKDFMMLHFDDIVDNPDYKILIEKYPELLIKK